MNILFLILVSDVPQMSQTQKTSTNPVKFGLDPGLQGLQGTSNAKSIKTKKKTSKMISNIRSIDFLKYPFVRGTEPWIRFLAKSGSSSLLTYPGITKFFLHRTLLSEVGTRRNMDCFFAFEYSQIYLASLYTFFLHRSSVSDLT